MTIQPVVWLILFGVLFVLFVFNAITNLLDAGSGLWARLARRYPAQPIELEAKRDTAQIYLATREQWRKLQQRRGCLTTMLLIPIWPVLFWKYRPSWYNVRYTLGPDHLHLELNQGRASIARPLSVPWAALEPISRHQTHLGEMAAFAVDEFVLQAPIRVLERELEIRGAAGQVVPGETLPASDPPKRRPPAD